MLGLLFYWICAVLAGTCAKRLYATGLHESAAGWFVTLLLAGAAFRLALCGLESWEAARHRKIRRQAMKRPSTTHGTARWGTTVDAKRAGLLKPDGLGYWGRLRRRHLYVPTDCVNCLTVASAGQGKGINLVVNSLLSTAPHISAVVTDVSGELCAITARYRRDVLKQRIVILNPFEDKLRDELGVVLPDSGFPVLTCVRPGPDVKDDAELLAVLVVPGQARMSGTEEFFTRSARDMITLFILYTVARGGPEANLVEVRRLLMLPPDAFQARLDEMCLMTNVFGGVIGQYAAKVSMTLHNAPEEFTGAHSTAVTHLNLYDSAGPMGRHVSTGTFDFGAIKDTPTTVYIILPSDRAQTHAAYMNLTVSLGIELACGRDRRNTPVLFLLDEYANIGFTPAPLRAMGQYRKQGYRQSVYVQSLGQLARLHTRDGLRDFLAMSDAVCGFGLQQDMESLQLLSNLSGQYTVKDLGESLRPDQPRMPVDLDLSVSAANRARNLIRPEELRTMPNDRMLLLYRNAPPFLVRKVPYFKNRPFRSRADANPYYTASPPA